MKKRAAAVIVLAAWSTLYLGLWFAVQPAVAHHEDTPPVGGRSSSSDCYAANDCLGHCYGDGVTMEGYLCDTQSDCSGTCTDGWCLTEGESLPCTGDSDCNGACDEYGMGHSPDHTGSCGEGGFCQAADSALRACTSSEHCNDPSTGESGVNRPQEHYVHAGDSDYHLHCTSDTGGRIAIVGDDLQYCDYDGVKRRLLHGYVAGTDGLDMTKNATTIHTDVASEVSGVTVKATPIAADFLLIEDSAAANVKKHITIGSLPDDATAFHSDVANEIRALTDKPAPVNADYLLIEDSADGNAKKRTTIDNLPVVNLSVAGQYYAIGGPPALVAVDALDYLLVEDASASGAKMHIKIADLPVITEGASDFVDDVPAKATPVAADYLLIEDSEAGNAKKSITLGDLPGALPGANCWTEMAPSVNTGYSGNAKWYCIIGAGDGQNVCRTNTLYVGYGGLRPVDTRVRSMQCSFSMDLALVGADASNPETMEMELQAWSRGDAIVDSGVRSITVTTPGDVCTLTGAAGGGQTECLMAMDEPIDKDQILAISFDGDNITGGYIMNCSLVLCLDEEL